MKKKHSQSRDLFLEKAYYTANKPGSFGGINRFKSLLKSKKKKYTAATVSKWLQSQDAYTLHKPVTKKFRRRVTIVSGIDDQFQGDLIDMNKFKKQNDGYSFILTVIDLFSKFAWAKPLKSKHGQEVARELSKILKKRSCRIFQTDKGKEFYNVHVQNILTEEGINHFSTENDDIKAACVERFNRTIQTRLYRWFTKTDSVRWIDAIEDIVSSYNQTVHSSTSVAPIDVTQENEEDIWLQLYSNLSTPNTKPKLNVGDVVRISKYKHIFSKGYDANWSTETFIVDEVKLTDPLTFQLRDRLNEKIHGTYYQNELQKVNISNKYLIEKILAQKKVGRKVQYLVKFQGYPDKFNEWVDKSDVS